MKTLISRGMLCLPFFCCCCLAASTLAGAAGRRPRGADLSAQTVSFLLAGSKRPKAPPKAAEVEDGEEGPAVAQLPPRPLPQTMLPRNMTADALKPPLGAAQVAPPPRQLVDVDVCRYFLFFCCSLSFVRSCSPVGDFADFAPVV